jgi:hypothetical protein
MTETLNPEAAPLENGEMQTKTAFLVCGSHLETDHEFLAGCREDVLRKAEGAWRVRLRTIVPDKRPARQNLSVFL